MKIVIIALILFFSGCANKDLRPPLMNTSDFTDFKPLQTTSYTNEANDASNKNIN